MKGVGIAHRLIYRHFIERIFVLQSNIVFEKPIRIYHCLVFNFWFRNTTYPKLFYRKKGKNFFIQNSNGRISKISCTHHRPPHRYALRWTSFWIFFSFQFFFSTFWVCMSVVYRKISFNSETFLNWILLIFWICMVWT